MTMTIRALSTALCVCLILSFSACASRPDEQIKVAQDAMKQALDQQADLYAPGDWKGAKELWDQAQAELAKEQFASAGESFLRAKARFLKVRDIAKAERDAMQKQVVDIQALIQSQYSAFKGAMNPAKMSAAAKKDFQTATADIDKRIGDVDSLATQGDYIQAKTLGQQTLQAIQFNQKKLGGAPKTP